MAGVPGDIGVWRDTVGGYVPNNTAWQKIGFATQDRNDNSFIAVGSGNTDFYVTEDGIYLIIYGVHYENTAAFKCSPTVGVFIWGFISVGSVAAGYSRDANNDDIRFGGAMIRQLSAGDPISIQHFSGSNLMTGGTYPYHSYIQIVRLPEEKDCAYSHYGGPATATQYNGTSWIDLDYSTNHWETDSDVIELQSNGTDIRLKKPNTTYLFIHSEWLTAYLTTARSQRISRAVAGSTEIPGTSSYGYIRDDADPYANCGCMFLYRTGEDPVDISIQMQRGNASADGAVYRQDTWSGVFVWEIPDWIDCAWGYDDNGGEDLTVPNYYLDAVTNIVVEDTDSWDIVPTYMLRPLVVPSMDALLILNTFGERYDSSGTRLVWRTYWGAFGVVPWLYGECANTYLRGVQGGQNTMQGAANYMSIWPNLQQYELFGPLWATTVVDGDFGGTSDLTVAYRVGGGAINLSQIPARVRCESSTWVFFECDPALRVRRGLEGDTYLSLSSTVDLRVRRGLEGDTTITISVDAAVFLLTYCEQLLTVDLRVSKQPVLHVREPEELRVKAPDTEL